MPRQLLESGFDGQLGEICRANGFTFSAAAFFWTSSGVQFFIVIGDEVCIRS